MSGDEADGSPGEEAEEVTRCICGNIEPQVEEDVEDTGLFVQCDKCLVWQHGYCVGLLNDSQMPETYHCELCRPDLHQIIQRPRKPKVSKYLGVNNASSPPGIHLEEPEEAEGGPRKRRSTMNSRDAAYDRQLEAALLLSAQQDAGISADPPAPSVSGRSSRSVRKHSPAPSKRERTPSPSPPREEQKQKRRKKGGAIKKEEPVKDDITPVSKRRGGKKKGGQASAASTPVIDNYEDPQADTLVEPTRPRSTNTNMPAPSLPPGSQPPSRTGSREGTPVPSIAATTTTSTTTVVAPTRKRGSRASKKNNNHTVPAVTRDNTTTSITTAFLPTTPSSKFHAMSDMRKRVSAILEFVGRVQEEMASEVAEWTAFRRRSESDDYQLVDNKKRREDTVWGYGYSEGGSVELIEELTGSLLRWESLYG